MNNIDKIIKNNLRGKYLRAPALKDVEANYKYSSLIIKVGYKVYYAYIEVQAACKVSIEVMCERFNENKTEVKLKEIIQVMKERDKHVRVSYASIFRPGITKGLFNREGIKYLEDLKGKLKQLKNRFDGAFASLKGMEAEVKFVDPHSNSIFDAGRNYHSKEISWILDKIEDLINKNKV